MHKHHVRLGSYDVAHCTHAVLVIVAQERKRFERLCAVWFVHLCNSAARFVSAEEMVAPIGSGIGPCFDISVKIDDFDSDDDGDDDDIDDFDSDDDDDDDDD